jgi:hypothetical protein
MRRKHQYVRNISSFLAADLPASTETLVEMRDAYITDMHERPHLAEYREEGLAEIERRLNRRPDFAEEVAKLTAENEAVAASLYLRWVRYTNGSKGPRYRALLARKLRERAADAKPVERLQ